VNMDLSKFERFAKTYSAGQIVFCEYEPGDTFYLIQSGRVKIVKIFGNIEKTIDILKPGEFFGEMALLENAPRSASIIALEDCKLLEFNRDNFEMLMTGNPQMALNLLGLFAKRIYDQKRRFSILTLADEHARVADVFVMLSEDLPPEDEDMDTGMRIFNHSVADIGHWAGMGTERVRDILNHFQEQRRVTVFQDRIEVTNIHDLSRLVSSRRKSQESQDA
jgi:CRP/FNR family transcriptional regulator, cyclic AMP receptor protein